MFSPTTELTSGQQFTKYSLLEKYLSVLKCAVSSVQFLVCSWEARLLSNLRQLLLPPARYQKQQNWEET